jgi:hypothetical protein
MQCGWCGAINPQVQAPPEKLKGNSLGEQNAKPVSKFIKFMDTLEASLEKILCCECSDGWFTALCAVVVVFTSALIGTIGVLGVFPVLWDLTTSPILFAIHTAIAVILETNIFFNYYAAVLRPAGAVQQFYDLTEVPPSRNSFENFTYCAKCAPEISVPPRTCAASSKCYWSRPLLSRSPSRLA